MRPNSIVWFDRLYWASFVLEMLSFVIFEFRDPEMGLIGSSVLFGFISALSAIMWFWIAMRASNVVRWIYVLLCAVAVALDLIWPEEMIKHGELGLGLSLGATILSVFSVWFLFRRDARRWFETGGVGEVDPKIFT